MSADVVLASESAGGRNDAVLRISQAICESCEPEELVKSLANEVDKSLHFDHFYLVVLQENSNESEYRVCGNGEVPLPDLPMEELPIAEAIGSPDPPRVVLWDAEGISPRFKQWRKKWGLMRGLVADGSYRVMFEEERDRLSQISYDPYCIPPRVLIVFR